MQQVQSPLDSHSLDSRANLNLKNLFIQDFDLISVQFKNMLFLTFNRLLGPLISTIVLARLWASFKKLSVNTT